MPQLPYPRGLGSRRGSAREFPAALRARARAHRRGHLDCERTARLPLARRSLGAPRPHGRRPCRHAHPRSGARLAVLGRAARGSAIAAKSGARGACATRGERLRRGRRHAEHRRAPPRRRQRCGGGARAPAHRPLPGLRCRGGDGSRARALRRQRAARRSASSAAARCGRRSCSSASPCPPLAWGRASCVGAGRRRMPVRRHLACRSTRRRGSPRRSCTHADRSRSSRSSRRASGARPIRACCARQRTSCRRLRRCSLPDRPCSARPSGTRCGCHLAGRPGVRVRSRQVAHAARATWPHATSSSPPREPEPTPPRRARRP